MEEKLERPTFDHVKPAMVGIKTKMSGNIDPQSPRHGAKLSHLAIKEGGGIYRVPSEGKLNCLCSPTTHTGSFRCRFHRTYSNPNNDANVGGKSFNSLSNLAGAHD